MNDELNYLHDIKDICDQLTQGCEAYHNAYVVVNYYNKYGYTEHFRELIGEESLVDQAKEVISKFISWLKTQFEKLINAIRQCFTAIRRRVCKLLGIKESPKTNNADFVKKSIGNLFLLMSQASDGIVPLPYKDIEHTSDIFREACLYLYHKGKTIPFDKFKQRVERYVEEIRELCIQQKGTVGYYRGAVREVARSIATSLGHTALLADTLVIALKEFNMTVSDDMTKDEFREAISDILRQASDVFDADSILSDGIQNGTKRIVTILTTVSKAATEICSIGVTYILEIDRFFNRDIPVEVTTKVPTRLLKKMEDLFGGSVNVRNIIITNRRPQTWGLSDDTYDNQPPYGWCYTRNNMSGSVDLYINYRLHSDIPESTKQIDSFICTIVHECYHLFLAQHGKSPGDNKKEEDMVTPVEEKYYDTYLDDEDRRWVKDLMRQIKSKLKR